MTNDKIFEELLWKADELGLYNEMMDLIIFEKSHSPQKHLADIADEILRKIIPDQEVSK